MERSEKSFEGQRVLVTQADKLMGPAISECFRENGATVIRDAHDYSSDPDLPARIVADAGHVDVLVINLRPSDIAASTIDATSEQSWQLMFNEIVHPMMRFSRAVLPQMVERKRGKIVVVSSAIALRPIDQLSTYCAVRGAQNAYVKAAGQESARSNVQINAVGQNWVLGGYPDDFMESERNRRRVEREVPAMRLGEGWEQAELVLYLASHRSDFMSGQVIPFSGGWVT
ncbi:MAG: SDR family oxidoreductase [Pseudomonadota bacterium]